MSIRDMIFAVPLVGALAFTTACDRKPTPGFLKIVAPGSGTYEILHASTESQLQFVSEESGRYNEDVSLAPGSYLVLADCSSTTVIIYPRQTSTLVAHRVQFIPPHTPEPKDSFSVQCSRSDKTKSSQMLANRYELNILHGKSDLLVGMVPMHIDFTTMPEPDKPKVLDYKLAGLQVAESSGNRQDVSYFVSPADELIAATKYQQFGHWEFLLPGRYVVELNGTRMQVELTERQERVIKPALFRVATSPDIDLDQPARVKGSPWLVEMNTEHWLNFNEVYPVLPGTATVSVSGSTQSITVELTEGQETELKARSIFVDGGCNRSKPDLAAACLGRRGVSLYLPEEPYPFVESVSDMPIVFIDQQQPVLVSIDGSRDITYEVAANVRDRSLSLGFARLIPLPQHRPGQVTDLVRVDSLSSSFTGHTLDILLERPSVMPLIIGNYKLDQFLSISAGESSSRSESSRNFTIEAGKTVELEFTVYFSEKKFSTVKKTKHVPADDGKAGDLGAYKHGTRIKML